jgi:hypothetical protein
MHKKPIELRKMRRKLLNKRKPMKKKLQRTPNPRETEHDPRILAHVHVTNLFNI